MSMWRKVSSSLIFNIFVVAVVSFLIYRAVKMLDHALVVRHELKATEERTAGLMKKKAELEAQIAEFESAQVVDREAKERLNLKRPGEVVVVVPEGEALTKNTSSSLPVAHESSWWERLKDFLTDWWQ